MIQPQPSTLPLWGVTTQAIVPVRATANHRSEMVTQLLWGECFRVVDSCDSWIKVASCLDGYKGWIELKMGKPYSSQPQHHNTAEPQYRISSPTARVTLANDVRGETWLLPMGSLLAEYDVDNQTFITAERKYRVCSGEVTPCLHTTQSALLATAQSYLHTPYLWGGRSPLGIDCSGFVQLVYSLHGVQLARDAKDQLPLLQRLDSLTECRGGDLAFFENKNGAITHVGLLLNQNLIIHASGSVRIDGIDSHGIYTREHGEHTHQLHALARVKEYNNKTK